MKKIFRKIKRIIDYVPILWNNEEWDVSSLLNLIDYKVSRMAKYVRIVS